MNKHEPTYRHYTAADKAEVQRIAAQIVALRCDITWRKVRAAMLVNGIDPLKVRGFEKEIKEEAFRQKNLSKR